jgi:hypothetical protein
VEDEADTGAVGDRQEQGLEGSQRRGAANICPGAVGLRDQGRGTGNSRAAGEPTDARDGAGRAGGLEGVSGLVPGERCQDQAGVCPG